MTDDEPLKYLLSRAHSFRIPYWETDTEFRYLLVDHDHKYKGWGIRYGSGLWAPAWLDGEWVDFHGAIREKVYSSYGRDDALRQAERLALEMNAEMIGVMERRFPGEFRGGPYDLAAQGTGGGHD